MSFLNNYLQELIQKRSTGLVGIEDSADGSAMLKNTLLVITAAPEDTGRRGTIVIVLLLKVQTHKKLSLIASLTEVLLFYFSRCCAMRY